MKYKDKLPYYSFGHIPSFSNIMDVPQLLAETSSCPQADGETCSKKQQIFQVHKMSNDSINSASVPNSQEYEAVASKIMNALQDEARENGRKIGSLTLEQRREKIMKYRNKKAKRKYCRRAEYSIRRQVASKRNRIQCPCHTCQTSHRNRNWCGTHGNPCRPNG